MNTELQPVFRPESETDNDSSRARKYLARVAGAALLAPVVILGVDAASDGYHEITDPNQYSVNLDDLVGGSHR